jgi:hypothetical protein
MNNYSLNPINSIKTILYDRLLYGPTGPLPYINDEKKFIMFWMPKCGCTTSIYWFFRTLGLYSEIQEMYPDLKLGPNIHKYRGEVWEKKYYGGLSNDDIIEKITNPSYFKFVIIRNPYSRLVSTYFAMMNPDLFNILVPDKSKKITFAQFVESLFMVNLHYCDMHLRSQTANICWSEGFKLDYIIKLEQLNHGLNVINDKFNLNVPIISINSPKKFSPDENICFADYCFDDLIAVFRSKGQPNYRSFYTPELREKAYDLFYDDIDTFGYSFDE